MNAYINEYSYTSEIISEGLIAWWHRKLKLRNGYISMCLCIVMVILLALLTKQPVYLALEIIPLLIIILFALKPRVAVKMEQQRIAVLFPDNAPVFHLEIGEDIYVSNPKGKSRVVFSDIEDLIETKNLIVLMVRGNMTITLDKRGFLQGNAAECMEYLKVHVQS